MSKWDPRRCRGGANRALSEKISKSIYLVHVSTAVVIYGLRSCCQACVRVCKHVMLLSRTMSLICTRFHVQGMARQYVGASVMQGSARLCSHGFTEQHPRFGYRLQYLAFAHGSFLVFARGFITANIAVCLPCYRLPMPLHAHVMGTGMILW